MKKILTFTLLWLSAIAVYSQPNVPAAAKSKAVKKAKAEAAMYSKKGFIPYKTSMNMYNLILDYYKNSFLETANGDRIYIYHQGIATGNNIESAVAKATLKAKQAVPGIAAMYFNSWASGDNRTTAEEKKDITYAVNKVAEDLKENPEKIKCEKVYRMVKTKKGKYQAVVRVLCNKKKSVYPLFRKNIVNILVSTKGWNRQKADRVLHFTKE